MVTPKLVGCNIFVAHDPGLHKFWVLRISGKDPQKPPDLGKKVTAQPKVDSRPAPTVVKVKYLKKVVLNRRM